uniref:HAT C-terminal dimerisation domain-containing protein n=1 Tax=Ananas comosus var. bracteatus TaxID=296719 RepID=A0A6V7NUI6_ANACO|nr:unnamed protein product [Ananas comosus var. bracteatus]
MFNSPEYSSSPYANRPHSISIIDILDDNEFWGAVEETAAISEPLLKVLRDVSWGKPAIGSIYESMTKVKDSLRTYYIMDEGKCKTFLDIVDRRPAIRVQEGARNVQFQPCKRGSKHDLSWDVVGTIRRFSSWPTTSAVRILSQVCSTWTFERNWSTIQQVHSEKRNRLDKETLVDLLYVHYNLRLRSKGKPPDADPIALDEIDMTSEWVEETENPNPTQWLDRSAQHWTAGI